MCLSAKMCFVTDLKLHFNPSNTAKLCEVQSNERHTFIKPKPLLSPAGVGHYT